MNKYVVAFFSDHTGELLQEEVTAASEHDAVLKYLDINAEDYPTMECVLDYCVNGDSTINVLQIDKKNWKHSTTQGPNHAAAAIH